VSSLQKQRETVATEWGSCAIFYFCIAPRARASVVRVFIRGFFFVYDTKSMDWLQSRGSSKWTVTWGDRLMIRKNHVLLPFAKSSKPTRSRSFVGSLSQSSLSLSLSLLHISLARLFALSLSISVNTFLSCSNSPFLFPFLFFLPFFPVFLYYLLIETIGRKRYIAASRPRHC